MILMFNIFIQIVLLLGLIIFAAIGGSPSTVDGIVESGFYLALATFLSGITGTALIIWITRYYQGGSFLEYLGLTRISLKQLGFWLAICVIYLILSDTCTYLLNRPIVPEYMFNAVKTARFPLLLYIALIVAAPVFEELFFRGFLLKGFSLSWVKPVGAVVLTSLCWSLLHLQYDWYGILLIFLGGLLYGFARLRTGSIYVTIAMHAFQNIVATVETLIMMK